jgi:hypothetical protein
LGVNASESINFIDYRGIVTWFYGNVNGTTVNIIDSGTSLDTLKPNMVVIPEKTITISNITTGVTTTINTSTAHGFIVNQPIFINNAVGSTAINGTWVVTEVVSTTSFIIAVSTTGTTYTANSGRLYPAWTTISSITYSSGVPISFVTNYPLQPAGADLETILYIYSNQGLIDASKDKACEGVFGYMVTNTVLAGNNTIQLTSVDGIVNGLYAQFTGSIPFGTTVTGVDAVTNTITLSALLTDKLSSPGSVVYATTAESKEACVVPLDTAPPFLGTLDGVSTDGKGINSAPSVDTFTVNANALALNIPTADIVSLTAAQSVTATFNRQVRINSPYFIILSVVVGITTVINTVSEHGYTNGMSIIISDAAGITAINGTWIISNATNTTFTISLNSVDLSGYIEKSGKTSITTVYTMLGLV